MSGSRKKLKFEIWLHLGVASLIGLGYLAWSGGADHGTSAAMAKALEPVGSVAMKEDKPEAKARTGDEVFAAGCGVCHTAGLAGAPKVDASAKADWEARLAAAGGLDGVVASAIKGKGGMPARGGNPANNDEDMRNAVISMLSSAGVDAEGGASAAAEAAPKAAEASAAVAKTEEAAPKAEEAKTVVAEVKTETAAPKAAVAASGAAMVMAIADIKATEAGENTYKQNCFACHDSGVASAPIIGDKLAWAPRLAKGTASLHSFGLKGGGAMPGKGGNPTLSDDAVKAAVDYMIVQSR